MLSRIIGLAVLLTFGQDIREAEPEKREELLHRITQHGAVNAIAIAPDGILAVAGDGLRIWDGINGTPLVALAGLFPGPFSSAAFSPDGTSIVGLSREGEMNAWGVGPLRFKASFIDRSKAAATGKNKAHFGSRANALAYSPDGNVVVSAGADIPAVKVWDAETGSLITPIALDGVEEVTALSFSPDGDILALATGGEVRLMKASDWATIVRTIHAHDSRINAIAFSPDGSTLATAAEDGTAHLWRSESGESIAEMKGHAGPVRSLAFSPDGNLAATASVDKTVRIWDSAGLLKSVISHPRPVFAVAFTEAGSELLTGAADNTVRAFRVPDWKVTARLVAPERDAEHVFLFEKDGAGLEDSAGASPRVPVSLVKGAPPKAASSELAEMASQILRLLQTNQAQAFDGLLSGNDFTIDGTRLLAGGQPSLQDREGVLARLYDTNRLKTLMAMHGSSEPSRFRSVRDILQAETGSVATTLLDRPKGTNQEDAATLVIFWKRDPMAYGLRDFTQFALAKIGGSWRIVDVSLPLDTVSPSRATVIQQRVRQLRSIAERLLRNPKAGIEALTEIVRDHESALAFEIRFSREAGQWWASELESAEIVFRWDGDPSDYKLQEYPRVSLHLEDGSWKIQP